MKKSLLILAAATAVGFAACTGGNNDGSLTPAQLDSIKQVTADSILNAQKLQSDSIANAQNALAVDSLKRINDSLAAVAAKPVPATPAKGTSTKKPTKKPSTGNGSVTNEPPVVTPAPVDKGSNTYRPGAKNSSTNNGTESSAPKSNSDRPGAR